MALEVLTFEQGTPEWFEARRGIPTASEFKTVMAKGKDGGASVTRRTYMLKLAGEIITGEVAESYSNAHMERGKEQEAKARDYYAFLADEEVSRVGFVRNERRGASPDALVGADGILEIKTALPHIHIDFMLAGRFPAEHKAQCQGNLWLAEREWIDITIYCPKIKPFIKRAYRDEPYIADIAAAVDKFNDELDAIVEKIRRYGEPAPALHDALQASLAVSA